MGKDKKEKNPADAYRKELRKKELLKLKKDRIVVKEVRDLLNDPLKIDEEIKKAQKVSDENKLDKSLKDRIKELQRMKEVALTKQLVQEAAGKVVKNSVNNAIDDNSNSSAIDRSSGQHPSIYQRNSDMPMPVVDTSLTSADQSSTQLQYSSNDQDHINARSRISTAGLELHGRPSDLSSSSMLLQDIAVPQPTILPYSQLPSFHVAPPSVPPPGYGPSRGIPPPPPIAPPFMGRSMGGVGGIPLPPPRPSPVNCDAVPHPSMLQLHAAAAAHPSTSYMYSSSVPPPPPPPPLMIQQMSSSYGGGVGINPTPPFQVQSQGEQSSSYASSMYGMLSAAPPSSSINNPYHPKDRRNKMMASQGRQALEIDPLDPAADGYTERFGVNQKRGMASSSSSHKSSSAIDDNEEALRKASMDEKLHQYHQQQQLPIRIHHPQQFASSSTGAATNGVGPIHQVEDGMMMPYGHDTIVNDPYCMGGVRPVHALEVDGPVVVNAEELMKRRYMIPISEDRSDSTAVIDIGPALGPIRPVVMSDQPVLSAEELMSRRHMIPDDNNHRTYHDVTVAVAMGPVLTSEELMKRRYMIPGSEAAGPTLTATAPSAIVPPPPALAVPEPPLKKVKTQQATSMLAGLGLDYNSEDDEDGDGNDGDDDYQLTPSHDKDNMPINLIEGHYTYDAPSVIPSNEHYYPSYPSEISPPSLSSSLGSLSTMYGVHPYPSHADDTFDELTLSLPMPTSIDHRPPSLLVKGPKIVKTEAALTAFIPNSIKQKRMHSKTTSGTGTSSSYTAASSVVKTGLIQPLTTKLQSTVDLKSNNNNDIPSDNRHEDLSRGSKTDIERSFAALTQPLPSTAPHSLTTSLTTTNSTTAPDSSQFSVAVDDDGLFSQFFQEINQLS